MTQHPKLGVKPDALSVVRCRDYHGHYYIEGAPFRISFWTYGTDIDADEAQRRLDFANELVAAWNAREAAEAREAALREALARTVDALVKHHQWHAVQTDPDPAYGFIPADEYADSSLYGVTVDALASASKATGPHDFCTRAAITKEPDA